MVALLKKSAPLKQPALNARFTRQKPYAKRFDAVKSSLVYKRARYYDTSTGEFASKDPLEYVDGMSLYRAYFVPGGLDPYGRDVWVENGTQVGGWHQRICVDTYDKNCNKTGKFCISFGVDNAGAGGSCADGGSSDNDSSGDGSSTSGEEGGGTRPPGAPTELPNGNENPNGNGVCYVDGEAGQTHEWDRVTSCCEQDREIEKFLRSYLDLRGNYAALTGCNCRTFSKAMFKIVEKKLGDLDFGACPTPNPHWIPYDQRCEDMNYD